MAKHLADIHRTKNYTMIVFTLTGLTFWAGHMTSLQRFYAYLRDEDMFRSTDADTSMALTI